MYEEPQIKAKCEKLARATINHYDRLLTCLYSGEDENDESTERNV